MIKKMVLFVLCSTTAFADTLYVDLNSPSPTPPYTSWATAATNIQDAVDVAVNNDVVLVADGVYDAGGVVVHEDLINRIAITKAITVESFNGPEQAIIVGSGPNGSSAVRCAYVGINAVLSGFTLTNGHSRTSGSYAIERQGGGAWCDNGASLTNCVLTGNSSASSGGGMYSGTAIDCTFSGNSSSSGEEELYNERSDPHELVNLANDLEYTEVKQRLKIRLLEWNALTEDPLDTSLRRDLQERYSNWTPLTIQPGRHELPPWRETIHMKLGKDV